MSEERARVAESYKLNSTPLREIIGLLHELAPSLIVDINRSHLKQTMLQAPRVDKA